MSATRTDGARPPSSRALARLAERVMAYAGLVLPDWVLGARMRERMHVLGLRSDADYAALVASPRGVAELEYLLEILRVGETRFFRHEAHVQALIETVLPALEERKKSGLVRAWSAGCASGEEAYTLAMILSEVLPRSRYQVHVLATDVSARAIEQARLGEYPAREISRVPEAWRERAFEAVADESASPAGPNAGRVGHAGRAGPVHPARYRITPALARCVRFERKNLLDGPYPRDIDIIWCRNVFIYFSPEARAHVARKLAHSLCEDGVLFVGYSESLRDVDEVEAMHTPHAVVYRRRVHHLTQSTRKRPSTTQPPVPAATARPRAASSAGPRARTLTDNTRDRRPTNQPRPETRPDTQSETRPETRPTRPETRPEPAARARALTLSLRGRYDGSGRLSAELSAAMVGNPERVIVDLDGAELLDDRAAPLLRRARSAALATGVSFVLRASRPGIKRWLRRNGLDAAAGLDASGATLTADAPDSRDPHSGGNP